MIDKNQQLSPQNLTPSRSSFLRRNWLTIITCILGIGSTYYFYQLSKSTREPVFLIDPIRAPVIDSKSFPKTTLRVVKDKNIAIEGDITSIRFYFWNNGKEPIRRENILNPIVVSLSDKGGEILDYKMLSLSRPEVIDATIERSDRDPKTSLKISFRMLEKDDGFTGQLLYSGDPNANLIIKGVIEGVEKIETNASLSKFMFYKHMFFNFGLPMFGLILFFISIGIIFIRKTIAGRMFRFLDKIGDQLDKISPKAGRLILILIPIVMIMVAAYVGWRSEYGRSQEEINKSLSRIVPSKIRP